MKLNSYTITQGRDRAPARAMLKAIGFTDEDLAKPIIGVANTWIETMPCNYNLRELAVFVKEGIRAAGGTPMEFNTIAISDGVTMGIAVDSDCGRLGTTDCRNKYRQQELFQFAGGFRRGRAGKRHQLPMGWRRQ